MTYVEHHQTVRDYQRSLPQYLDLELGRQYKGWCNFTKREQDECRMLERNAMISEGYVQQPNGGWIKPEEEQPITITPKRAPIQRKTTAFPLLDGISEGKANRLLFALRKGGFAAWIELHEHRRSGRNIPCEISYSAPALVTEASLEQLCACAGPALGYLK